jgi:hypothetical protein
VFDEEVVDLVRQFGIVFIGKEVVDEFTDAVDGSGLKKDLQGGVGHFGDAVGKDEGDEYADVIGVQFVYFWEYLLQQIGLQTSEENYIEYEYKFLVPQQQYVVLP